MKTSTLLTRAKANLSVTADDPNAERFICFAIDMALANINLRRYPAIRTVADQVVAEISKRLGGYAILEHWLYDKGYIPRGTRSDEFFVKIQETRHAWIDSMIAEYKAKGD